MHHSMLFTALALFAVAQGAPAAVQTTTTTSSSTTTTTTLGGACTPDEVTLPGLACSLDAYLAAVRAARAAGTLGRLGDGMVKKLEKGVTNLRVAQRYCADRDGKRAGKQVQRAGRAVAKTRWTIGSLNGRKIIKIKDESLWERLGDEGRELVNDLRRLRRSISCS